MKTLRIGTRNSPLALWQAQEVAQKLTDLGYKTELVPIVSQGDKNLIQPLYEMGIVGVFTKDLDVALLNNQIDIAVHSLKDIPTQLPKNIRVSAVLERDFPEDVLIRNPKATHKSYDEMYIGCGSLRRQSYWKHTFPDTTFGNIRGNIQTRLQKMEEHNFDGVVFSLAGIKRMNWNIDFEVLDFIVPAPGQGVVACTSLENDIEINQILSNINHTETMVCTQIERQFLQTLEGGCSAPIGAFVQKIDEHEFVFSGGIVSLDGKISVQITEKILLSDNSIGEILAQKILAKGGKELLQEIRK